MNNVERQRFASQQPEDCIVLKSKAFTYMSIKTTSFC